MIDFRTHAPALPFSEHVLSQTAAAVAATEKRMTQTAAAAAAARQHRDQIGERISAIDATRQHIISRRAQGDQRDGDAAEHDLLCADTARLRELHAEAVAAATAAEAEHGKATAAAVAAARQHKATQAALEATALEQRLHEIEATLVKGIAHLATLRHAAQPAGVFLPSSDVYVPSPAISRLVTHGVMPT